MIHAKDLRLPDDHYPVHRALLSVFDKSGLVPFAQNLHAWGVELVSTGGTARALREAGLPVADVSDVTGFPEILDGRVKTLHPAIHGGVLARRNDEEDIATLANLSVHPIDLIVVDLYPFEAVVAGGASEAEAIEHIDVGGATLIRAAAKNHAFVGVVTSPSQYDVVAGELAEHQGCLTMATRRTLATEAFRRTAGYDRAIEDFFESHHSRNEPRPNADSNGTSRDGPRSTSSLPETLCVHLPKRQTLRYGENPHQEAALYGPPASRYEQLHGKPLSFNNLIDLDAALQLMDEFVGGPPTCAILKHTNPCGVAQADSLERAYAGALATDRLSPFGGIVVVNRPLDIATAEAIDRIFTEIIIAPAFGSGVLDLLTTKKNRRLIRSTPNATEWPTLTLRSLGEDVLVQTRDKPLADPNRIRSRFRVVTERLPDEREWRDLDFAWRVVKHVKSNAIVYARDGRTLGIGAGQMSRVDASEIAILKGSKSELDFAGSAMASDAFFPFADALITASQHGVRAAIQPGGSIRDDEVVAAANEHGMAMVCTGTRLFRH